MLSTPAFVRVSDMKTGPFVQSHCQAIGHCSIEGLLIGLTQIREMDGAGVASMT